MSQARRQLHGRFARLEPFEQTDDFRSFISRSSRIRAVSGLTVAASRCARWRSSSATLRPGCATCCATCCASRAGAISTARPPCHYVAARLTVAQSRPATPPRVSGYSAGPSSTRRWPGSGRLAGGLRFALVSGAVAGGGGRAAGHRGGDGEVALDALDDTELPFLLQHHLAVVLHQDGHRWPHRADRQLQFHHPGRTRECRELADPARPARAGASVSRRLRRPQGTLTSRLSPGAPHQRRTPPPQRTLRRAARRAGSVSEAGEPARL